MSMLRKNEEKMDTLQVLETIMSRVPYDIKGPLSDFIYENIDDCHQTVINTQLEYGITDLQIPDELKNSYENTVLMRDVLATMRSGLLQ